MARPANDLCTARAGARASTAAAEAAPTASNYSAQKAHRALSQTINRTFGALCPARRPTMGLGGPEAVILDLRDAVAKDAKADAYPDHSGRSSRANPGSSGAMLPLTASRSTRIWRGCAATASPSGSTHCPAGPCNDELPARSHRAGALGQ